MPAIVASSVSCAHSLNSSGMGASCISWVWAASSSQAPRLDDVAGSTGLP